jgi:NAD(P)-dependent dehydrogenase (short-subunit alcohol dehydrogenase family)
MAAPALLTGRTVVVTGSAEGPGLAAARAFAAMGATVLGVDARQGFEAVEAFYRADLSDPAAVDALAAALPDGVHGLAHFAAPPHGARPDAALALGLIAPRRLTAALAPRMAEGAAVVVTGEAPGPGWDKALAAIRAAGALQPDDLSAFVARWGLDAEPAVAPRLARRAITAWAMAHRWSWAARGLRINAVCPGAPHPALPPGAAATDDDVAAAAAFLLSGLARGLTGAALPVDGGLFAHTLASHQGL